jgi:hypothetical protein
MRERVLETHEPSCMARPARPFFIPEACDLLRAAGHMAASEPSRAGRQGLKSRGSAEALQSREAGSEDAGHVAAPEPS